MALTYSTYVQTLFVDFSFSFWEEIHSETTFSGPKDKRQTMRAPSIILTRFRFDSSSSLIMGQPLPILLDLFYYFLSKTVEHFACFVSMRYVTVFLLLWRLVYMSDILIFLLYIG
jgi:hypothetical protein